MSKRSQQLSFFNKTPRVFGGSLLVGRRRTLRPLSSKQPIHLVMRSLYARGPNSLRTLKNFAAISELLEVCSRRFGVKIYKHSINSNHIHLILKITHRSNYKAFIRMLSGKVASHIMRGLSFKEFVDQLHARGDGVPDTSQSHEEQRFWEHRPFTRLVSWGRDYVNCCKYLLKNTLEAIGFIPYTPRKQKRSHTSDWKQAEL